MAKTAPTSDATQEQTGGDTTKPPLRDDGPTIEEFVKAGYKAENYPQEGFAEVPSPGLTSFRATGNLVKPPTPPAQPQTGAKANPYAYPIPPQLCDEKGAPKLGVLMLMEACTLYGVNPDQTRKPGNPANPRELHHFEYRAANAAEGVDEYVQLVTCGGQKLRHPADADTVDRLRRIFRRYKEVRQKDGSVDVVPLPLPDDLTLPTPMVTGISESDDHRYERGYLREGGAKEATLRAARRKVTA